MSTSTTILLIIATALLIAAALTLHRASGPRQHDIPTWPAASALGLAVVVYGVAAFTA